MSSQRDDETDPDRPHTDVHGSIASGSSRMPGYDVARAIALFGMVLVNFRGVLDAYDHGTTAILWLADRLEGKAGALFVLLAGVGVSLATRQRDDGDDPAHIGHRALLERATILLVVGLLLMHVWEWDILHFHGVYLLLAIPLVRARSGTLWALAFLAVWGALVLDHELAWSERPSLTTFSGAMRHLLHNGLYPVFPWMAFVLVGMIVGRLDLADDRVRRRTLLVALAVAVLTESLDTLARWDQRTNALGLEHHAALLLTWPRGPRPVFIASGCAYAVVVICACISLTRTRADRPWVLALVATGQLAFTLYVGHAVAILVPVDHGLLRGQPIEVALAYGVGFYVVAIAFALWWRRRWEHGPIEGLMRQVTRRERAAPPRGTRLR
jgi:uncharacterized protein